MYLINPSVIGNIEPSEQQKVNKDQITVYMAQPETLGKESMPSLFDMVERYPYCQTAHLLLVKCLKNENHIHFNEQLKTAAAVVTDRKMLQRLLERVEHLEVKEVVENPAHLPEKLKTDLPSDSIVPEISKENQFKKEQDSVQIPVVLDSPIPEPKAITSVQMDSKPEESAAKKLSDALMPNVSESELSPREILEKRLKEIGEKNKASSSESSVEPIQVERKTKEDVEASLTSVPEKVLEPKIILSPNELEASLIEDSKPIAPEEKTPSNEKVSIDSKVKEERSKDLELHPEKHDSKELDPIKKEIEPEFHSFNDWLKLSSSHKTPRNAISKTKVQDQLIERFINTEPRITQTKTEFFKPSNLAKLSVEDSYDFVSETLAKIYFDQGNYPKALMAYEKLILRFPEKSVIFAGQIKAIQKILNEK